MSDLLRFQKAAERFETERERFSDECARLTERWCVEQSYKWPKRTLTLWTGNGSTTLEVEGKRLKFQFRLDINDDRPDVRQPRGCCYWRQHLETPDLGVIATINSDYPNDYYVGGSSHQVQFQNGRKRIV